MIQRLTKLQKMHYQLKDIISKDIHQSSVKLQNYSKFDSVLQKHFSQTVERYTNQKFYANASLFSIPLFMKSPIGYIPLKAIPATTHDCKLIHE